MTCNTKHTGTQYCSWASFQPVLTVGHPFSPSLPLGILSARPCRWASFQPVRQQSVQNNTKLMQNSVKIDTKSCQNWCNILSKLMQNSVKIDAKFYQNHSKNPSKPNQKKRWAPLSARTYRWASFQPVLTAGHPFSPYVNIFATLMIVTVDSTILPLTKGDWLHNRQQQSQNLAALCLYHDRDSHNTCTHSIHLRQAAIFHIFACSKILSGCFRSPRRSCGNRFLCFGMWSCA